jgi:hypothetical protein
MMIDNKKVNRKSLSVIRLYRLAQKFITKNKKVDMSLLADFLKFVSEHKDDLL